MRPLSILVLCSGLLAGRGHAQPVTPPLAPPCQESDAAAVFASPRHPLAGEPLRAIAVSERPRGGTLAVVDPAGAVVGETTTRRGGPPYWWYLEAVPEGAGTHRVVLEQGITQGACREIEVAPAEDRAPDTGSGVWQVTQDWNRATENLFAAWIEHLFDDPLDAEPTWRTLHEVTRDAERNFLYDHLGLGEDGARGLRLEPDCADLPYLLRAYFAWKLGLPFGYSECSSGQPPRCGRWRSNPDARAAGGAPLARMQAFFGDVAAAVQSSAGRAPGDDDRSDFYPIRLAAETLRPGTVYADPYGHTLILVRRLPQTGTRGGLLLAVDAQPDGTVARKRYWRGTFLFARAAAAGSAGFKRFRPIVRTAGGLHRLDNDEIADDPSYGDFDLEQDELETEEFYDRVDAVLSPRPQDPARVLRSTIDALHEQVRARIRSVANGQDYVSGHPGMIAMPDGAAIFRTTGPWEDYATPARDLRLLIAIDVVRDFPDRVVRQPERFVLPVGRGPDELRAELEALFERETSSRRFAYTRSDGSSWRLSLADVLERTPRFEMAYNPNDCVEVRWGAPPQSEEAETCRRRAPAEQAERMRRVRTWFSERRRPPG